jgi:hypothetical protein
MKMNETMKMHVASKRRVFSWWFISLPLSFVLFLFSFLEFNEFYQIGILADPREIQKYYFGGAGMIGHGGWKYASANTYAISAFVGAFLYLLTATAFLIAYKKRSRLFIGLAIGIFAISIIAEMLLNLWCKYIYEPG